MRTPLICLDAGRTPLNTMLASMLIAVHNLDHAQASDTARRYIPELSGRSALSRRFFHWNRDLMVGAVSVRTDRPRNLFKSFQWMATEIFTPPGSIIVMPSSVTAIFNVSNQ